MAQATVVGYSKFRILLGDGASPEVFTAPCGLNTRSLDRTKTLNELDIPDCADEDAPAWVGREVKSLDWTISGEGLLTREAVQAWEDFFASSAAQNVRIEEEMGGTPGTITHDGAAHLSKFTITGERGNKVQVSIELAGDGALVTT